MTKAGHQQLAMRRHEQQQRIAGGDEGKVPQHHVALIEVIAQPAEQLARSTPRSERRSSCSRPPESVRTQAPSGRRGCACCTSNTACRRGRRRRRRSRRSMSAPRAVNSNRAGAQIRRRQDRDRRVAGKPIDSGLSRMISQGHQHRWGEGDEAIQVNAVRQSLAAMMRVISAGAIAAPSAVAARITPLTKPTRS